MTASKFFMTILATLLMGLGQTFAQGLELSPVRFDYSLEPGQSSAQTLTVRNTSNKSATYTLTAADWYLDEMGNVVRLAPNELARSCADWVSFSPTLVELEPNASQEVTVTLNVPGDEMATKWAIVYVSLRKEQQAPQADKDLAMGIEVNQAIGVFITQSPKSNRNASAKLTEFKEITAPDDEARRFSVRAENTGDKILDCKMYMVISDLQNATETRLDPVQFKVLPEGTSMGELSLPADLDKGNYLVAAILDYGPSFPLEGAQMQIEIK